MGRDRLGEEIDEEERWYDESEKGAATEVGD